jgi:hypothetical protein
MAGVISLVVLSLLRPNGNQPDQVSGEAAGTTLAAPGGGRGERPRTHRPDATILHTVSPSSLEPTAASVEMPQGEPASARFSVPRERAGLGTSSVRGAPHPPPAVSPPPAPTYQSRTLVNGLTQFAAEWDESNPGTAEAWNRQFQQLAQQGPAGVAAISEYLQRYEDIDFGPAGWQTLGYPTLRAALIDTLGAIGGPEALEVSLKLLQNAAEPREVALLARALEMQDASNSYPEIMAAARRSLSMAADGQLEAYDVGPVFEVFGRYGEGDVVADLVRASGKWNHYAAAALGQLPDGIGVPSLISMAYESSSARIPALQTLAGLSAGDLAARDALLGLVEDGWIAPNIWPYVASALTGDEVQVADSVFEDVVSRATGMDVKSSYIRSGNQTYYRMPTIDMLTPEQLVAQVDLVDEFLQVAASDPAAVKALEQTRSTLLRRIDQMNLGETAPESGTLN